jgi:3D (Asp-Asp-Asp) domain-containing protein
LTTSLVCVAGISFAAQHPRQPHVPAATARRAFVATAYCRGHETATGAKTNDSVAAADPRVLPLGTHIRVLDRKGRRIGAYRVLDTGRKIRGRRIDLFFSSCAAAKRFGRRPVRVGVAP